MNEEFIQMIEKNERIIYKVASFYVDDEHQIKDLYQEVVINLWKGFSKFRGESKQSTWIYRVALNTCITMFRKTDKVSYVDCIADVPDIVEHNPNLITLYELISRLGKIERALILLYLEDRSYKEIAEIMGLSVTNVGTKMSRAKEKLKEMSNN